MKQNFFAAFAVLFALAMTGCGAQESSSDAQDAMPYGATLTQDVSRGTAMRYDKRFLDAAAVDQVYAYYHAIQTKDAEAFSAALLPLYHAYQLEDVYGGDITDQALVDNTYDAISEYFGYDFEYTLLDITDAVTEDYISADRDSFLSMLDDLAADKGEPSVSEHTQAFYEVSVTRYIAEQGSGVRAETDDMMEDEKLFAIQYDGEWYVIYM